MGIETAVFAAMTAISVASSMNTAQSQAKAITANASSQATTLKTQGDLQATNQAKQTTYAASTQRTSFLSSGLTLDGTAGKVIAQTFNTGLQDTQNISTQYQNNINNEVTQANSQAKNTIGAARSAAIKQIAGSVAGASVSGSMGSMFQTTADTGLSYLPESASFTANNIGFGNDAYNALQLQDERIGGGG